MEAVADHQHYGSDSVQLCDSAKRAWQEVGARDGLVEILSRKAIEWKWWAYSGWGMTFVTIAVWIIREATR